MSDTVPQLKEHTIGGIVFSTDTLRLRDTEEFCQHVRVAAIRDLREAETNLPAHQRTGSIGIALEARKIRFGDKHTVAYMGDIYGQAVLVWIVAKRCGLTATLEEFTDAVTGNMLEVADIAAGLFLGFSGSGQGSKNAEDEQQADGSEGVATSASGESEIAD